MNKPINVAELLKQGKTIEEVMEILKVQVVEADARIRDQKVADRITLVDRIKSGKVILEDAEVVTTMAIKNEFPGLARIIDEGGDPGQSTFDIKSLREMYSDLESMAIKAAIKKEPNMDRLKATPNEMTPEKADEILKKFLGL